MLATESVRLASQAAMFHQQPTTATTTDSNAASAAASCFYKHKIINELKAGAQRARAHRFVLQTSYRTSSPYKRIKIYFCYRAPAPTIFLGELRILGESY